MLAESSKSLQTTRSSAKLTANLVSQRCISVALLRGPMVDERTAVPLIAFQVALSDTEKATISHGLLNISEFHACVDFLVLCMHADTANLIVKRISFEEQLFTQAQLSGTPCLCYISHMKDACCSSSHAA